MQASRHMFAFWARYARIFAFSARYARARYARFVGNIIVCALLFYAED